MSKDAEWRSDYATDKQKDTLRGMGIYFNADITKGEAAELLSKVFNAGATDKQIWTIRAHRLHDDPELLTKREAQQIIKQYYERIGRAG